MRWFTYVASIELIENGNNTFQGKCFRNASNSVPKHRSHHCVSRHYSSNVNMILHSITRASCLNICPFCLLYKILCSARAVSRCRLAGAWLFSEHPQTHARLMSLSKQFLETVATEMAAAQCATWDSQIGVRSQSHVDRTLLGSTVMRLQTKLWH